MKILVTGAAGFIGSNLVDALLLENHTVVGIDNLSTGRPEFLNLASKHPNFDFKQLDILNRAALSEVLDSSFDCVCHLAANADVRRGIEAPFRDLEQNTIATWNVLEAMRDSGVKHIVFTSTGSVYGEAEVIPTPENAPFPVQTSLYGASKLACEALISAYCEGYNMRGTVYRFVSFVGDRYTHGHIYDFVRQLLRSPDELRILGDGSQRKSYIHVSDGVAAIAAVLRHPSPKKYEVFNLGTSEYVTVNDSIAEICAEMGVCPERLYSGGSRGWVGDNPFIYLDCSRIRQHLDHIWAPKIGILDGVRMTVRYLLTNKHLFDAAGSVQ